jgi:hypothetical protein
VGNHTTFISGKEERTEEGHFGESEHRIEDIVNKK